MINDKPTNKKKKRRIKQRLVKCETFTVCLRNFVYFRRAATTEKKRREKLNI